VNESLWERAFQLAYFILLDRSAAHECVARALEKLAAQRTRERRRGYWRLRKRELKIRRISRPPEDSLQWLIFLESESCEKTQEMRGQPTEADMIVRYIKHLAQLTTVNSSFHVNIGFNRLLRRYTTPEVQQVYELATRRYPGSEEYRKAKGKLLEQLAARFERFLRVCTAQYGELQFEVHPEQQTWSGLVEECLRLFTPWSGHGSCLQESAAPAAAGVYGLVRRALRASQTPDHVETGRCHWFMHSTCFCHLTQELGLAPPLERLSVPRFLHQDDRGGSGADSSERRAAPLSDAETGVLRDRVSSVMARQGAIPLEPLRIVAHGVVCSRLDPARDGSHRFDIPEGTRLLELRSDTGGSDRILATHWVAYDEDGGVVGGEYTLDLQGGRQLTLGVIPKASAQEEARAAAAVVTIESRLALARKPLSFLRPALASVALVTVGVLAASVYFGPGISRDRLALDRMARQLAQQQGTIASLRRTPDPLTPSVRHYAFGSGAPNIRGEGNTGEPIVTLAAGDSMIILELPVADGAHGPYRARLSTFPQQQERLTEVSLQAVRRRSDWIVEFALPAALVENDTHYLLALTRAEGTDARHYLFKVRKK
jgi:hypothetical protein